MRYDEEMRVAADRSAKDLIASHLNLIDDPWVSSKVPSIFPVTVNS